jgi:xanthine dehydrogenase YagR molybdenum-binding subunit
MNPSVGQSLSRLDGRAKVTGAARYTADWPEKNVAFGVTFMSSIASGRVRSFDLELAKRVPGVIEIITHENAETIRVFNPKIKFFIGGSLPFQDANVYYYGQPLGVVVAETLEAAEQAARLVQVHYRIDEAKLDFEALRKDAKIKKKDGMGRTLTAVKGDVEKEIKNSKVQVTATYRLPIENHHPMETSSTLAVYDGDQLTVYDATQGVANEHKILSAAFDVKKDKMRVISKFIGGGFGCKGSTWSHAFITVMAAKKTKRPVKLVTSRTSMSTNVGYRANTIQEVTLASDANGKLLAIKHETVNPVAMTKEFPETTGALFKLLYECPAISTTQKVVEVNYSTPTFMRAPGECSGSFALESAMDELAHKLNMDPIELRLKNYAEKDPMKNVPFTSKSLRQCYEQGAKKFGWNKRKAGPGLIKDGDYYVGYGMATSSYPVQVFPTSAKIELSANGKAKVRSASQDIGTGAYTIMPQLASDALGIAFEDVDFDLGDSNYPPGGVSGGSSTTGSLGWAISDASKKIFEQLKEIAIKDEKSALYNLKANEITISNAKIYPVKEPNKSESIFALMKRNQKSVLVGDGETDLKTDKVHQKEYSAHSYGAQFAEVRVHALTGEVKLTKMVGAFAAGRIVNPKTARSQFMGGMIFGIGMGLTEQNPVDLRTGMFMARDLGEYHVPVNKDVPDLDIITIDEVDTIINPAGTKGIGEIGTVGTAAAIANAVFNATGIRVREIPITPDKLVAELSKRA